MHVGSLDPGDSLRCVKDRRRIADETDQQHGSASGADLTTIVFHKPYGVQSCFTDPDGRPTLAQYIDVPNVYAAGRLDADSEGLLVLTSDGALAHRITDPQHKLPKTYWAQVERVPTEAALLQLRTGIDLGGRRTKPAGARLLSPDPELPERAVPIRFRKTVPTAWLELTLSEGMNRQVRRMTAAVGHPTLRLIRVAIGPLRLGDLAPGRWRLLTDAERQAVDRAFLRPAPAHALTSTQTPRRRNALSPSNPPQR